MSYEASKDSPQPREPASQPASSAKQSVAPGKRTRTMGLPPRPAGAAAPVQQKPGAMAAPTPDPMADPARRERSALTARWLDTAVRPDLYPPPDQAGSERTPAPSGASLSARGASAVAGAFDADLSSVRVHEGDGVAEKAGAMALTQGRDIHFARGAFDPASERGRFLIGHELAHVVQQRDHAAAPQAKAAGPVAGALRDDALEAEADRVGRQVARGQRAGAISGRVTGSMPVAQHFGSEEHMRLGDDATADEEGSPRRVQLADDYSITYGEMVAMAGDFFTTVGEMRLLAQNAGTGAGTREEIEYVRVVKVHGDEARSDEFSSPAREAVDRRYYRLAGDNRSHFVNPESGDAERSVADRATDTVEREWGFGAFANTLGELPANAPAGYRLYHTTALGEAAVAGREGRPIEEALASEAFACHYLTDSFSAGHVRTERASISEYWNAKVPMFFYNLQGYIAEQIARELQRSEYTFGPVAVRLDVLYHGVPGVDGALSQVSAAIASKGSFQFGDLVSGALHDYDNANGVRAEVAGQGTVTLYGDEHLGQGDEERLAQMAVRHGLAEVERAYALGRSGMAWQEAVRSLLSDGTYSAERLIPRALPDEQQGESQRAIDWQQPDAATLLADARFREALQLFCREKAGEFESAAADFDPAQQAAFRTAVVEPLQNDAPNQVAQVIEWTPNTGGGALGHNQDDNALDYYEQARQTPGGLASLSLDQRRRLMADLLDGPTVTSDEDAVLGLLTSASASDARSLIQHFGWQRLYDEIDDGWGEDFAEAFPSEQYR